MRACKDVSASRKKDTDLQEDFCLHVRTLGRSTGNSERKKRSRRCRQGARIRFHISAGKGNRDEPTTTKAERPTRTATAQLEDLLGLDLGGQVCDLPRRRVPQCGSRHRPRPRPTIDSPLASPTGDDGGHDKPILNSPWRLAGRLLVRHSLVNPPLRLFRTEALLRASGGRIPHLVSLVDAPPSGRFRL